MTTREASEGDGREERRNGHGDASLLRRLRAGDPEAFAVLFGRHEAALRALIRRRLPARLRRRMSVSDVLQESRIVAQRLGPSFEDRGEGALGAWLLRIADLRVREAIQVHLGTAKRAANREESRGARDDTRGFAGSGRSPSDAAMGAESRAALRRAFASLSPDHRMVLRRVRLEGASLAEVAEETARSREAVKKLYARALRRLTDLLRPRSGREAERASDG